MGSCARNRNHLNAYLDGELPERSRCGLERHLAECPACRRELDALRGLAPFLANDEVPPAPAGMSARIMAEAALRRKRKASPIAAGPGWRDFLFQPRLAGGATVAALVVGLAVGAWMGWASRRNPEPARWTTTATAGHAARAIYAFDVLSAEPHGSIEAAALALFNDGR